MDKVWKQMGYTNKELEEYFTGPAYFPWFRMGNIYKHSGPVPKNFFPKTVELQKKIIAKMHALGINPVAPSFAGFVPPGFKSKFPDASIRKIDVWAKFKAPYTSQILHPLSPYFQKIGNAFIKEWTKQYGKASFFLADAFNEMLPPVTGETEEAKLEELALYGKTIYESITTAEPEGTWLMMGWMFLMDKDFWTEDRMEAFFIRIPNDKMMVLDLFAESQPQFSRTNNFYGKSWMYSVIPNWGGNSQLGGWLTKYGSIIPEIKQRNDVGKLVAFGYSPEGTENNEVIYELVSDAMWSEQPINYSEWLKGYCAARYGLVSESLEKAWNLLCESVYNREASHLNRYQGRHDNSGYIGIRKSPVQNAKVDSALILFNENYEELHENELYKNDLIELEAYVRGAKADSILAQFKERVEQKRFKEADQIWFEFSNEMKLLDSLFAGHSLFRLERWINLARSWGENKEQCDYFEADAKRLISYWGSYLSEYAAKTWRGMVADYYLPRWEAWYIAQKKEETFDSKAWERAWVDTPWNDWNQKTDILYPENLQNKNKLK
ncbi:alpha-N-acetylglucosaminidase TIM-barrel domain-containing protein [Sunxiuqinia rutila]|uniref:alpha-N-acetylglucosaminidase TIM-barrel domain-containing protein n=1 Tax=Sunxiuqinia rutila TaxID=1397841 RepID=UPI003D362FFC